MTNMPQMNKEPFYADFNEQDVDGAIWIGESLLDVRLNKLDIAPSEGLTAFFSDGDVVVEAKIEKRQKTWVAVPLGKFKDVDPAASYHISNLK